MQEYKHNNKKKTLDGFHYRSEDRMKPFGHRKRRYAILASSLPTESMSSEMRLTLKDKNIPSLRGHVAYDWIFFCWEDRGRITEVWTC